MTNQELRNAIYTGQWLTDAKRYFSKTGCPAYNIGKDYLSGNAIRQDYLETVIEWISDGEIEEYMATHQHEPNANELWLYFNNVMTWVKTIFPNYRKEMKGLPFGIYYNKYRNVAIDNARIESKISQLMQDEDVTKKAGIYEFIFTNNDKYLNIRSFTDRQKREAFERQNGVCAACRETFSFENVEADHITPWHSGGQTRSENCQILCRNCNRTKSGR